MRPTTELDRAALRSQVPGAVPFPGWLSKLAVAIFLAAACTATWGGFYVVVVQAADIFLFLSLAVIVPMIVFGSLRFAIPWWIWPPAAALLLCVTVRSFAAVPDLYYAPRYQLADLQPGNVVKATFWILAIVGVPIATMACSALEPRVPRWLVASFLAGISLNSLIALSDLSGLTHVSRTLGYDSNNLRQVGLTAHPNTLGLVCTLAAPLAIYLINESRHRWLPCAALVLLCGGVLASGSRGAQAAFPVVVLAAVLVSPRRKKVISWLSATFVASLVGGVVIIILAGLGATIRDELLRFGGAGASSSSDSDRLVLALQAINDVKHYPFFGIGIKHINEAHNIYLQIVSAGGIVLAAGMAIYWFGALRASWLVRRRGEALGSFLLISIATWLLLGAIENQLTDRMLYYTVGAAAALAVSRARRTPMRPDSTNSPDTAASGTTASSPRRYRDRPGSPPRRSVGADR